MKLCIRGKDKATTLSFEKWPKFWGIKVTKKVCPLGGDEIIFSNRWFLPNSIFNEWTTKVIIAIRREAWRQGISLITEVVN